MCCVCHGYRVSGTTTDTSWIAEHPAPMCSKRYGFPVLLSKHELPDPDDVPDDGVASDSAVCGLAALRDMRTRLDNRSCMAMDFDTAAASQSAMPPGLAGLYGRRGVPHSVMHETLAAVAASEYRCCNAAEDMPASSLAQLEEAANAFGFSTLCAPAVSHCNVHCGGRVL